MSRVVSKDEWLTILDHPANVMPEEWHELTLQRN